MRQLTQLLPSKPVAPFPALVIDAGKFYLVARNGYLSAGTECERTRTHAYR
jgi:hypothetical protein